MLKGTLLTIGESSVAERFQERFCNAQSCVFGLVML